MLLLSARSGALAARIGPRLQMSVGPLLIAAGMLLLTRVGSNANYLTEVLPAAVVVGLGLSTAVAPLTAAALSTVPPENAGIASGVNNDVARTAGLLAVAVLPALAGIRGDDYRNAASFNHGFDRASVICAGLALAASLLAALTIRNPRRRAPALTLAEAQAGRPSCTGTDGAPLTASCPPAGVEVVARE
jgi:MFS family permease